MNSAQKFLCAGAVSSFALALLHVGAVLVGESAARIFNAPRFVLALIQQQSLWIIPVLMVIVAIFGGFGLLAWSGAGRMRRLPWLRTGLVAVSSIYLLRGLIIVPLLLLAMKRPGLIQWQAYLFCVVALALGAVYLRGTVGCWRTLKAPSST